MDGLRLADIKMDETIHKYCKYSQRTGREFLKQIDEITKVDELIDLCANSLPLHYEYKQRVLSAVNLTHSFPQVLPGSGASAPAGYIPSGFYLPRFSAFPENRS